MYDDLAKILRNSDNIVFFGGAGVSTESNIPDFRSEQGLYNAKQAYGKSPEDMISRSFFMRETETFYDYYKKNLIYQDAKPNKAHYALAKLESIGKVKAIVTQNIDGLHQKAGSKNVFELHGSVLQNICMECGEHYNLEYIMDKANCDMSIPKCKKCGGIVKPKVVLYEEALEDSVVKGAVSAIQKADVLIVGGTSLVVYPAAGLINYFKGTYLILINKTKTQYDNKADLVINEPIGQVMEAATENL